MESPGEFELIARLTGQLTTRPDVALGVGDDCAILDLPGPDLLLLTCDSQVEGVHFSLETASPEQVGRKALAINLSDIAAMGGEPRYANLANFASATLFYAPGRHLCRLAPGGRTLRHSDCRRQHFQGGKRRTAHH